jgi:plasmid stabilization system protein ParE
MVEIRWSAPALEDLQEIAAFIGRDSEQNASSFVKGLVEMTEHLPIFRFSVKRKNQNPSSITRRNTMRANSS